MLGCENIVFLLPSAITRENINFDSREFKSFYPCFSDRTLKVWSLDGLSDDMEQSTNLKAKAVVAAHDKDINSLAIAPNDSFVCSGSQVSTS